MTTNPGQGQILHGRPVFELSSLNDYASRIAGPMPLSVEAFTLHYMPWSFRSNEMRFERPRCQGRLPPGTGKRKPETARLKWGPELAGRSSPRKINASSAWDAAELTDCCRFRSIHCFASEQLGQSSLVHGISTLLAQHALASTSSGSWLCLAPVDSRLGAHSARSASGCPQPLPEHMAR